jgi:protein SCO1/2
VNWEISIVNVRRVFMHVASLAFGMLLVSCSGGQNHGSSVSPSELTDHGASGAYHGFGLNPAQPRPLFTLTDSSGKRFPFGSETQGRPTLLFFGYTNCPDVCPTTLKDVQLALQKVPRGVAKKTIVVFVSTDVKRDTGAVIKQWLSNFESGTRGATFVGLRGTQDQINAAQAASHVQLAEDDGQTHSAELLLYGPDDYARVSFLQSNSEQDVIAHDLPIVARANS